MDILISKDLLPIRLWMYSFTKYDLSYEQGELTIRLHTAGGIITVQVIETITTAECEAIETLLNERVGRK